MSEQVWLALLSVVLSLLMASLTIIGRMFWNKVTTLETNIQNSQLAAFMAMDKEREKQWMLWRDVVDDRLSAKRVKLEEHEHRLTRLERNGHG